MLIFVTVKQFYDFCEKNIKAKYEFKFDNNHVGYIILKKTKLPIGKFEIDNEIYLDRSHLFEFWK